MSLDIAAALKEELAKPEVRHAINAMEHQLLEATKRAVERLIPGPVMALAGGLVDAFAEKGITTVEHLTDEALLSLGTIHVELPTGSIKMVMVATPNSDQVRTIADLPPEAQPK